MKKLLLLSFYPKIILAQLAAQKCQEYAALVHETENSPVLAADPGMNEVNQCGIVETPLIIGGQAAGVKEFPHMAQIGYGNEPRFSCGGSVISETAVLSAAHCANSQDGDASMVRVGVLNTQDLSTAQLIPIMMTIVHPEFQMDSKYNDIAIMKLAQPIQFNAFVRPACLNVDPGYQWDKAIVTGFGQTERDAPIESPILLKLQLLHFDQQQCAESYADNPSMTQGVLPSQFCAGEYVDNKDSCQGDSGGPIQTVLAQPYCMYNIIGVVSFGKLCGFANTPAIYTNVASYIPWIEANAWN